MKKSDMNPQMGMEMMKKMMGGGKDSSPMQMCKEMTSSIKMTAALAAFATPELHALFKEWLDSKEKEVFDILVKLGKHDLVGIAKTLKLTPESTAHLLTRLAAQGRLILVVQPTEPGKSGEVHVDSETHDI